MLKIVKKFNEKVSPCEEIVIECGLIKTTISEKKIFIEVHYGK